MRRVETAENSVPVRVIALRPHQVRDRLGALQRSLGAFSRAPRAARSQFRGHAQHFFVQQIGLGIFAEKSAPESAAQESPHVGPGRKFVKERMKFLAYRSR